MARSAMAVMVRLGLTPGLAGTAEDVRSHRCVEQGLAEPTLGDPTGFLGNPSCDLVGVGQKRRDGVIPILPGLNRDSAGERAARDEPHRVVQRLHDPGDDGASRPVPDARLPGETYWMTKDLDNQLKWPA